MLALCSGAPWEYFSVTLMNIPSLLSSSSFPSFSEKWKRIQYKFLLIPFIYLFKHSLRIWFLAIWLQHPSHIWDFSVLKWCPSKWLVKGRLLVSLGFPDDSVVNNPPAITGDTGDVGLIPGSGRSPGVGNGNLFHYSCLENSMDRGAWWSTVHGVAESRTWLSTCALVGLFLHIESSFSISSS